MTHVLASDACSALVASHKSLIAARMEELVVLFKESSSVLHPFGDPLESDLLLPFLLDPEREETYSAVLEWLLARLPADRVPGVFGVEDIDVPALGATWVTEREVHLRRAGKAGRLDLTLTLDGVCRLVIEVKTKAYGEEDLEKHDLYCTALERIPHMRDARRVFVACEDEGWDLRGFRFWSWRNVCLRLRQSAPPVVKNNHGGAALFLSLLGALEQNLLAFNPQNHNRAPEIVEYMREYLR